MTDKDTHAAATPTWVKVFGIVAVILVVLVVVFFLIGRAGHGPGRHTLSGGHTGPPPGVNHRP
jgi:hypothetical protein